MPNMSVNCLQYGAEVDIRPREFATFYLVHIPIAGSASICADGHRFNIGPGDAAIVSPSHQLSTTWTADCRQLMLKIDRRPLESFLSDLVYQPIDRPLEFPFVFDLKAGLGASFYGLIQHLASELSHNDAVVKSRMVCTQLEQTLLMLLLCGAEHSYRDALQATDRSVCPKHVVKAYQYMLAHARDNITIEDLTRLTGVSGRALYEGFRRFKGASPMACLRAIRMQATPAAPVFAQSADQTADKRSTTKETNALEEIVVTAEKRESTVQKTPISMTAISEAELQARGLSDFRSIAQETPGVSMKTSGPGQTEFEMRGLTATGGFSPTVGFYVDDAPLTAPAQAAQGKVVIDPDLYDLNRVEVLRGPQGTLYGAGSMGGTIKLVTNPPQLNTVAMSAQTTESGANGGGFNYGGSAMLNLPLAKDVAAVRFVGTYKSNSGWIDRIVLNPFPLETNGGLTRGDVAAAPVQAKYSDVNWEKLQGGRVTLLLQLGDNLTITPGLMYQKISLGGASTIDGPPGNVYAYYQPFDFAEPLEDNFSIYTLNIKYHFDFADLTSATAKWNRHDEQTQDISETIQDLFGFPAFTIAAGGVEWRRPLSVDRGPVLQPLQLQHDVAVGLRRPSEFLRHDGLDFGR